MSIPILFTTSSQYSSKIKALLTKGSTHSLLIYKEWMRTGSLPVHAPAFFNAKQLLKEIVEATDFSLLPMNRKVTEGDVHKLLFKTPSGFEIESVVIPMQAGGTLCVSSQVGCKMACSFCETGKMGLIGNLTSRDIVSQVFTAKNILGCALRNVVFMGMGEPFDNYDSVMEAVQILCDPQGFGFGERHITISTSGIVPGIERLMRETRYRPNLAVSLNSADESLRKKLMPITRKYDLKQLYDAMRAFNEVTGRKILVAYVLIKGKNDTLEHADLLAQYLQGLNVKINLIPYNPQSSSLYEQSDISNIQKFKERLKIKGFHPLLRLTKGSKIMAACGQLGKRVKTEDNPS
ncbi:putative dual-specificity RNA methyltransferase RlmN 1 [Chlamydiales bacterium STE3]|nr:putative dual-specificity RNA methyltransferase RlmN 1 [Chlamydiales bacterium STE3]